jgi:hypothetical protein
MTLHLLAAAFAVLMLLRHGPRALRLLARGVEREERWRALPSFLTAAVAVLLLLGSLTLLARQRAP